MLVSALRALVFIGAAFSLFLLLLNRWLLLRKDSAYKTPLIIGVFLFLISSAGLFGWSRVGADFLWFPIMFMMLILLGEARRAWLRMHSRGSVPVQYKSLALSLTRPFTTTDLQVLEYTVKIPDWQGRAFTVVHLSDLHVDDNLPLRYFQDVVACANDHAPDFVFLTGDFVTRAEHVSKLPGILNALESAKGVYAVLGNHDHWVGEDEVANLVLHAGVTLLRDTPQSVPLGKSKVLLLGDEYPWGKAVQASIDVVEGEALFVLTHTPDNIYRLSHMPATAVFAGHYHAGQLQIPLLGSIIVPSVYGRRFDHGHFIINNTHLFVTAGIGSVMPPFRIFCRPDIIVVKFH